MSRNCKCVFIVIVCMQSMPITISNLTQAPVLCVVHSPVHYCAFHVDRMGRLLPDPLSDSVLVCQTVLPGVLCMHECVYACTHVHTYCVCMRVLRMEIYACSCGCATCVHTYGVLTAGTKAASFGLFFRPLFTNGLRDSDSCPCTPDL